MARRRENRRRGTQYTGILRGGRGRVDEDRDVSQIETRRVGFSWRIVSGLIVVCLSGVLALFFYSDVFYVRSIAVGGTRYMTIEEVFTYADIANMHIFWIEPEMVRENLLRYPTVADAQVRISWPPNMVNITLIEREPALIWEQGGRGFWVDVHGNVMAQRQQRDDLVRIAASGSLADGPLDENGQLDEVIVFAALSLQELRPDVPVWRYDSARGLGFRNANGWDVWFGVGTNMAERMQIYEAISSDIIARGIQPGEIHIVNPDAPYYTVLWGR